MKIVIFALLCLGTSVVYASAGQVVFTYGETNVITKSGDQRELRKRDEVNPGDTIITGKRATVQLRMVDKGFISIRQNSRFKIEAFQLGATKEEDSGFFSLLKGGFRAITGVIGKRLKSAYKVATTTATIGIRGTDYTARLCNQDCSSNFGSASSRSATVADGLYVGVNDGGVILTNDLGSLDLDELQYGYVKDAGSAPVALLTAPDFLFFRSRPPDSESDDGDSDQSKSIESGTVAQREAVEPESGDISSDSGLKQDTQSEQISLSETDIEQNSSTDQTVTTKSGTAISLNNGSLGSRRSVALALGEAGAVDTLTAASVNPFNAMTIKDRSVTQFEGEFSSGKSGLYHVNTARQLDLGYDPTTGISWGRWTDGSANFTDAATQSNTAVDLNGRSLHWVSSPDRGDIALPSSGSVSFKLVGNTSPTDNLGNTGILGSASLTADFSAMTTTSSVAIGINNQVWNGSGSGPMVRANGHFSNTLTVTGTDPSQTAFSGQGSSSGFITNNAEGAGMGYALEATINSTPTNVTGTAIFQQQ